MVVCIAEICFLRDYVLSTKKGVKTDGKENEIDFTIGMNFVY